MNAAGGQRELLSLLMVLAAEWADGVQPKWIRHRACHDFESRAVSMGALISFMSTQSSVSANAAILIRLAIIGIGCVLQWTLDYLKRWIYDFETVTPGSA
jgi:hypothetical protein